MKNKDIIILNGASYDVTSGQLVSLSEPAEPLLMHHAIGLGTPGAQAHHIAHHKAQKSTTLKRQGLMKPSRTVAKNIKSKSTPISSSANRESNDVQKSVFVRKFASSHNVLVKKTHKLPVVKPLRKQLAHHVH